MANIDTEDPAARDGAKRVLDWGVNDEVSVYHPYWRNPLAATSDDDILISLWQLPDSAVLGVFNYRKSETKDHSIEVDVVRLGLDPDQLYRRLLWTEDGNDVAIEVEEDALHVRGLPGHRMALIGRSGRGRTGACNRGSAVTTG